MANIVVKKLNTPSIEDFPVEIVERKGIGHPDSLCDGIAEAVSEALCKMYKEKIGTILHHNTDQVELVGGYAYPELGGGSVVTPIYVLLSGRATTEVVDKENNKTIKLPVGTVAVKAAREYIKNTIINIDLEKDIVIDCRIGPGSVDLVGVFNRENTIPLANDTSFGVGHAPFSVTEKLVLKVEQFLNSKELKKEIPAIGEDIKVMGLREGKKITLTIAMATVDKYINSVEEYNKVKENAKSKIEELINTEEYKDYEIEVLLNTADKEDCIFLTVTGTSSEMGDDGSVGRGNRANGLITPFRPMSMEATSGKNPINHIGKLYNLMATQIAQKIADINGVKECHVRILSQIGKPVNEPKILDIELITEDGHTIEEIEPKAKEIAEYILNNIEELREKVISGEIKTF